jgi:hypothetical protein
MKDIFSKLYNTDTVSDKKYRQFFCAVCLTVYACLQLSAAIAQPRQPLLKNIDSILAKTELIPMMITGEKDNRINIVIMNRWTAREKEPYNKPAMRDSFLAHINGSLVAALTPGDPRAQTVFAHYRNFFNVYALWWPGIPEWDRGVDISIADSLRNRLFLPWKDEYTGWVTLLAMPNVRNGGGGAARNLEERIGNAVIAGNGIGKMLHEISHTCMSLGDEYTGGEKGMNFFPTYNSTTEYDRDKIKWRKWVDPATPLPTPYTKEYINAVGAFEGNQYHLFDYFRSSAQGCIMGAGVFDNTEKMCAVCEQRVTMRVYSLVNPIKSQSPASDQVLINGNTVCRFSIDHIKPEPNTQTVRWILNGKTIATGADSVSISLGALEEYELICRLTDETPFIRPDPPFGQYPQREIKWHIRNLKPVSPLPSLSVSIESIKPNTLSLVHTILQPLIKGGKPPYSFRWSTGDTGMQLQTSVPGLYTLQITDREFRQAEASFLFYETDTKKVSGKSVSPSATGTSSPLLVKANIGASAPNAAGGSIQLDIAGGTAPYRAEWLDPVTKYTAPVVYEAEAATVDIPGHTIRQYYAASKDFYVASNGKEGGIVWKVTAAKAGMYPLEIFYAAIRSDSSKVSVSVNGDAGLPVTIYTTRPMYTGWEKAALMVPLQKGQNWVRIFSTGQSLPNIDFIQVPSGYTSSDMATNRKDLKPGVYTVRISDSKNQTVTRSFIVPQKDIIKTTEENSSILMPAVEDEKLFTPAAMGKDVLLWLDATDMDGDGKPDQITARGTLLWKDKINGGNQQILVKYYPKAVNGKPACGFDNVWVQSLGKEVQGFQTIIMVYRETDMSFPGHSPFVALSKYIGKSRDPQKSLFDPEKTDQKTRGGNTFFNGHKIDPFTTPNPMQYGILVVELSEKAAESIRQTDGLWEGVVSEMIILNRTLSDTERSGIENYLRKKWFSADKAAE